MQKWIMFVLVSVAALLAVGLLAFGMPEKPIDESANLPEGTSIMKLEARNDFTFNQAEYTAKVGDTLIIKYSSKGIHGADIKELNISLNKENPEATITLDKPGEYLIECNILCGQGHATMVSKLIVTEA